MGGPTILRRALGRMTFSPEPKPLWVETIQNFPPITFSQPEYIKRTKKGRVPKPPRIDYAEDTFRRRFFKEHPLETFRPATLDERAARTEADLYFYTLT